MQKLTQREHPDGTRMYRCEEVPGLQGFFQEPSIYASAPPELHEWHTVEDPVAHCLSGKSLLLSGMPGTGKTHLARHIVSVLRELGDTVQPVSKTHSSVQNIGLGAQTADHWVRRTIRNGHCRLEEITQLDAGLWADIACLSMNRSAAASGFFCWEILGSCRLFWMPLRGPLKDSQLLHDLAGRPLRWPGISFPGCEPDVCLVISHARRIQINERENRRLASASRRKDPHQRPADMRVWSGLKLVEAGAK